MLSSSLREAGSPASHRRAVLATVVGTTGSVLPAFLTGAVGVQLAEGLGLDDQGLGFAVGSFFASAALASAVMGRTAERMGAYRAMRVGLLGTAAVSLVMSQARSPLQLALLLVLAGSSNALTQPSANLLLADVVPVERWGIAVALKQAGMPTASLLGGVAVPALALTAGWRWTYVAGALLAALAVLALPRPSVTVETRRPKGSPAARPDLAAGQLVLYGLLGMLGAATAGATITFLVKGAEASGIAPGPAGLLLTAGSALGIASRLIQGRLADGAKMVPIRRVALLLFLGSLGMLVLALDTSAAYVVGIVPMFAFGWAWPGLYNLAIVRDNPSAPAAATGLTQTGVYLGAGSGPIVGGLIAGAAGYRWLWLAGAAGLLASAAVATVLAHRRRSGAPAFGVS